MESSQVVDYSTAEATAALWQRIAAFELDAPLCGLVFSERAARENGWSPAFTRRAIEEYKRFLFLAMTCDHVVCPSDAVDQIWHMHLTYTRSYWDELCQQVLGRPLHHGPTRGGSDEQVKYFQLYRRTLQSYREVFDCEPPVDIWPPAEKRFGEDLAFVRINRQRHWVVPKPRWSRAAVGAASGALLVPLAQLATNPLDWHGEQFLVLYFGLLLVASLASWVARLWLLQTSDRYQFQPGAADAIGPIDVAWMRGGPSAAVDCALVELVQKDAVAIQGGSVVEGLGGPLARADHRVSELILQSVASSPTGRKYAVMCRDANVGLEVVRQNLIDKGLALDWSQRAAATALPIALLGSLLAFGGIKAILGLGRDKPIGFLVLAMLATLAALLYFLFSVPRLTLAGKRLLTKMRAQALADPHQLQAPESADSLADDRAALMWSTAFLGSAALASTQWSELQSFLTTQRAGNAGASGGCGTSGCGGDSGCGGGCGGGGCGGCGGD